MLIILGTWSKADVSDVVNGKRKVGASLDRVAPLFH